MDDLVQKLVKMYERTYRIWILDLVPLLLIWGIRTVAEKVPHSWSLYLDLVYHILPLDGKQRFFSELILRRGHGQREGTQLNINSLAYSFFCPGFHCQVSSCRASSSTMSPRRPVPASQNCWKFVTLHEGSPHKTDSRVRDKLQNIPTDSPEQYSKINLQGFHVLDHQQDTRNQETVRFQKASPVSSPLLVWVPAWCTLMSWPKKVF